MKIALWDKDESGVIPEINTKDISLVMEKYLKKIGGSSLKATSLLKANQLFLLVIEDFKKGVLSSDDLAGFGFKIFHSVAKRYPKSDLFEASLSASELTFAIRKATKNVPQYLEVIDKFYEKNK